MRFQHTIKHFIRCTYILFFLLIPVNETIADKSVSTLRVALNSDILSTNPGVRRDSNTDVVLNHIFESLVAYKDDISVGPLVAKNFSISDDRTIYTFQIRQGLKFHNGEPVTAADVKWSWDRYLRPETNWKCRRWFVQNEKEEDNQGVVIKSITVSGKYEIEFLLDSPNAIFLELLANFQCLPAVVHKSSVDSQGNWVKPIGTGPYKFKKWKRGEYIELEKFADYLPRNEPMDGLTGARIALTEKIKFQILTDAAATRAALLSGSIDIFAYVPMHMVEELESQENIRIQQTDTLGWSELLIQTLDPILRDVNIRKAIAHAINREEIIGFTTYGQASINSSGVPAAHPSHTVIHDKWYEFSPDKSRALLKKAGYRGQLIKIQTNRKHPGMYNNALVVQAMLQAVGINCQLELLDWASQLNNYYSGDFQLMTFSFSAIANPTLRYSKLIGLKDRRPNSQWDSRKADDLIRKVRMNDNPEQINQIYEDIHQLMIEEIPIIGLYNARISSGTTKNISGFSPWPLELVRLWGGSVD